MNTEKTFEESCYDFQQEIINTVNNERNLPFLIKYFIIKEIWEDVQEQQQMRQFQQQPEQVEGTVEEE